MSLRWSNVSRVAAATLVSGLVFLGSAATAVPARADSAPVDPANPVTPATVSADALPTVQVNGVVWSQAVVGNTVYVAGEFTRARPAGAAAGTQETVRNNLLAYDIRTGALITSFAPDLNAQALVVTASPDGSRIYVGGDFEVANGKPRYHIAAYNTATGALLDDFQPAVGSEVKAIAATASTVYVGGWNLGSAGGASRSFLAAFNATTGAVTSWNPVVNHVVNALAVVNNGASVVVAGHFSTLNGAAVHGIGEVSATTGANQTFAASNATLNGDDNSAFTALSVDNDTVYATGYSYGTGNLEGTLAINPNGGALRWVEDCHGDSYSIYATGTVEYLAGHPHTCGNIAGFPQIGGNDQTLWTYHRAIAFSKSVTGVIGTETGNFIGQPAPSLLTFFPDLEAGTYTGQYQGPWSVSGNGQYVVYGGEFPTVNGRTQQGLVRFAVPSVAPNKIGPADTEGLKPVLSSLSAGAVRISWQTASDKDNSDLTYSVYRSDKPDAPVYETTASSTFWARPTLSFLDQTAPAGKTVSYSVTARDPFGNSDTGAATSIAVSSAAGTALDDYAGAVVADGPVDYWRLGESSGNTLRDVVGNYDLTRSSGVTLGRPGALTGRTGTAAAFNGTATGIAATQTKVSAPRQFSMEAWFSTTSTSGGKLIGFGDSATGLSNGYDRQITMNTAGKLSFGVYNNTNTSVSSTAAYNDGKWHHVVATVSGTGMALFVDGAQVASKTVAGLVTYDGYWKLGGDRTWDGSNPYLNATVDDVAVYPAALTAAQVARHYTVGTTSPGTNKPPTAAFSSSVSGLTASLDGSGSTDADGTVASYAWDFGDGQTGSGKTASHGYAAAGTYSVKLTVTDNAGTTGTVTKSVTVSAPTPPPAGSALAADAFGRELTGGWGSADTGGAWTIAGTAANAVVTGGSGRLTAAAGASTGAALGFSARDVSVSADLALEKAASGGGSFASIGSRAAGSTMYNTQLIYNADGSVGVGLVAMVNGAETYLAYVTLPDKYTAGTVLKVRFEAVGTGTTALRARVWPAAATEPTAWTVAASDGTAALQGAGGLYTELFVSKSATAAQTMRLDNLAITAPGATPAPVGNVAPTAAFSSSVSGLTASLDGSGSTDPDGTVASYEWELGDGVHAAGRTLTHTYAAAGTYSVKLTVTDNAGTTGTVTKSVTVTVPPAGGPVAADAFAREVTGGWGSADTGGAWTIDGTAANAKVTAGSGRLTAAARTSTGAALAVSAQDVAFQADVTLEKTPSGSGSSVALGARNKGPTRYNAQLWFNADGTVTLSLISVINWNEIELGSFTLPGTYVAGTALTVRFDLSGTTSTALRAKAWTTGTAEPADWQVSGTGTADELKSAGGVVVDTYTASSATAAQTVRVDNLWVGATGTKP